jgi:ribosome-associated translation inhibitor RaiA
VALSATDERRLQRQLAGLERRLLHHPAPTAVLVLTGHQRQRQVEAELRVQLGPLGGHLISHQQAETVNQAVHRAVADIERQLERQHAAQSGAPSFGVPSRRLPEELRPSEFSRESRTPATEGEPW